MFVDPTQEIRDLDGKPIEADGRPVTFSFLAVTVLMAQFEGEEKLPGTQKLDRFDLAEKLHGATMPVEITNDQADLILRLAEKGLPILTYSRISRIISAARAAPLAARKANGRAIEADVHGDTA